MHDVRNHLTTLRHYLLQGIDNLMADNYSEVDDLVYALAETLTRLEQRIAKLEQRLAMLEQPGGQD